MKRRLPSLALFGSAAMSASQPLSGEKRKWHGHRQTVVRPTADLALKSTRDFRRSAPLVGCAEMPQLRNRRRRAFWLVTTSASRNRSRSVRRRNTIAGLAARACQFPDAAAREVRRSALRRDRAVLHGTSLLGRRMQGSLFAAPPS